MEWEKNTALKITNTHPKQSLPSPLPVLHVTAVRTTLESSTAGKESNKRPFPFSAPCYASTTSLGESVKTQSLSTACELCEHPSSATDAGRNKRLHSQQLFNHHPRPLPQAQLRMLCYTVLRITLQASTKSKLRATHIHHGQVSNILKI